MKRLFVAVLLLTSAFSLQPSACLALDPVTDNIVIQGGEDYAYTITYKDGAGLPMDVSGRTYKGQLRATYSSASALAEFAVSYAQAPTGIIVLTLPAATTRLLAGQAGVWDLRETAPDGTYSYLQRGTFRIDKTVTQ